MPFELSRRLENQHLIVQSSDLLLNPPESYFYIQDGLIITCGVLYAMCYFFYAIRTYKDRVCAGFVEYLSMTMAYELFYAYTTTSTNFELYCFLVWFSSDVAFVTVVLTSAYAAERRSRVLLRLVGEVVLGVAFLRWLCGIFPDEREQFTAFWTGVVLQFPISWGSLYLLLQRWDTRGHSLEIWITRYLGCWTAYGLFAWRYLNVPENWSYVGSSWSVALIALTLLAETVYPFVYGYVWMHGDVKRRVDGKVSGALNEKVNGHRK